jgi:hypothetical protein
MIRALELLTVIARHLQERDESFDSGLWTQAEILTYMSEMQREFLQRTGVLKNISYVAGSAHQIEYDEPASSIDVERISWNSRKLYPSTQFEFDQNDSRWRQAEARNPRLYHRDNLGIKRFAVTPAPNTSGLSYSATGTVGTIRGMTSGLTYTTTGNGVVRDWTGQRNYLPGSIPGPNGYGLFGVVRRMAAGATNFTVIHDVLPPLLQRPSDPLVVPDAFSMYVMYGALYKAWAREGDGQDLRRAAYCKSRFDLGVQLAERLMTGTMMEK